MRTEKLKLVLPNKKYLKSYQDLCQDFITNSTKKDYRESYETNLVRSKAADFFKNLRDDRNGLNLKERGRVAQVVYWAIVNDAVVGRISLRPKMNAALRVFGGNVGYSVSPKYEGNGYGTEMLKLLLVKVRKSTDLKKLVIMADKKNIASRRVIEKQGGILVKTTNHKGARICHYQIIL